MNCSCKQFLFGFAASFHHEQLFIMCYDFFLSTVKINLIVTNQILMISIYAVAFWHTQESTCFFYLRFRDTCDQWENIATDTKWIYLLSFHWQSWFCAYSHPDWHLYCDSYTQLSIKKPFDHEWWVARKDALKIRKSWIETRQSWAASSIWRNIG